MLLRWANPTPTRAARLVLSTARRPPSAARTLYETSAPGPSRISQQPVGALSSLPRSRHYVTKAKKGNNNPTVRLEPSGVVVQHHGQLLTLSPRYLLDHCRCSKCFHSQTKQRLKCLSDFHPQTRIKTLSETSDGIEVTWELEDQHVSVFPWLFFRRLVSESTSSAPTRKLWGAKVAEGPPSIPYDGLVSSSDDKAEQGVLEWLGKVDEHGFCFVHGVPATPEATEELIRQIGTIRQTHYGGFWDFTADMSLGDLAYSSQSLPAHTDTTYFTDPCGLQIFHLLSHPPPGTGGLTLLVDGFNAAMQLEREQPGMFQTLSSIPVPCHASGNAGLMYRTFQPVITLTPDGNDKVEMIRWNNEDRGVLVPQDRWDGDNAEEMWYDAAREFESILRRKENEYWVQLEPGTVCVIDNWRVLHGRSAFTGSRRMCGAYISRDDWRSRFCTLQRRFNEVPKDETWDYGW